MDISYNPISALGLTSNYTQQNKETEYAVVNGFNIVVENHGRENKGIPVDGVQEIDTSQLQKVSLEQLVDNGFLSNEAFIKMQDMAQQFVKQSALTKGTIQIGHTNPIEGIGFMSGLQPIFHSEAEELAYQRKNMDEFLRLADAGEQLKQKFGEDVRVARDTVTGDYMMLRPSDYGYDIANSTEQALSNMRQTVGMSRYDMSDFSDILSKYNV